MAYLRRGVRGDVFVQHARQTNTSGRTLPLLFATKGASSLQLHSVVAHEASNNCYTDN